MKVICEQNKVVSKIWGKQKVKETEYRIIRYALLQKVDEGILLYNLVTGEMVLVENMKEFDISCLEEDDYRQLIEKHFLVSNDYNELDSVRHLRKIAHHVMNTGKGITSYTIMPTSHCNARCFYCFEADFPYVHMSEETADRLVEYMVSHCDDKRFLNLTWFGGEPTVGAKRIDQICEGLQRDGIEYSSFMYSNGYLFDEKMVRKAVDLWKLHKIQITLDGTEEVYNKAKAYKSVKGSPYKKVLGNIKKLLEAGVFVLIRLNMDLYNYDDLKTLINELSLYLKDYTRYSVYVSVLFDDEGFETVNHSDEDKIILEKKKIELESMIAEKGMMSDKRKNLASLLSISCCADNDHAFLINPKGQIAKCDHAPDTDVIGDIFHDQIDYNKYSSMKMSKEFDICKSCKLYPTCYFLNICSTFNSCNQIRIDQKLNGQLENMMLLYNRYIRKSQENQED